MKKIILCYLITILLFTVFSYLFIDPNLIHLKSMYTGFAFTNRLVTTIIYSIFVFGFFAFYLYFLKMVNRGKINAKTFKILLAVSCIVIFSYPAVLSYDIFNYLATSKVLYFYHENPYLVMPIEFKGDTMLLFTRAANKYALYGPTWLGLSAVPYFLSVQNFFASVILFKGVSAMFYIGVIFLIFKITKNWTSVVFFALNPLVILEILVSGHNDIVMMFFAFLSFYLLHRKSLFLSVIFIILSILVKYATLFLLPVFLYVLYMQIQNKKIELNKVWLFACAMMFLIFIFSFIREEIYPWYAVWFLPFVAILEGYKKLKILTIALTFGLMLYYIPYMLLGTYFFPTPILKILLSGLPVVFTSLYLIVSRYGKSH